MFPKKGPVQWEMHLNQPLIFRGHVSVHGSTPPKFKGWKLNTMVSKRNVLFQPDLELPEIHLEDPQDQNMQQVGPQEIGTFSGSMLVSGRALQRVLFLIPAT